MTKSIAIIGGGESGTGVALLAQREGYDVFLTDSGPLSPRAKALLTAAAIPYEEGTHTIERILAAEEVVKSPGIPDSSEVVKAVAERGLPVLSEIEFCVPYLRGRVLAITGSNGKTTTCSLVYHILRTAGYSVALCGNIGRSLAMQLVEEEKEWYVVEVSSFQLDNCYTFRPAIAVLLNLTADHLDRYGGSRQRYFDAKLRLLQNQTAADTFIYWAEDEHIEEELRRREEGKVLAPAPTPTSRQAREGHPHLVAFRDDDFEALALRTPLLGIHNRRNVVAAYYAATAAGVPEEEARAAIATFSGVEHRLEYVATKEGIDYINDSKATNVDACRVALLAMTKPTILIVGGLDKGNDYSLLLPLVRAKCRGVVLLGADNSSLRDVFSFLPTADTHTMADCVAASRRLAHEGDVVLLSPCCASFDLFKNMEDRGEQFVACVNKING